VAETVLTGGRVIDPAQGVDEVMDVVVRDGSIADVAAGVTPPTGSRILDVAGKIVTPGWIDIHAHVYWGVTTWGILADPLCLASGVTTIVDAGSPGWANFPGFNEWIAKPAVTRVLTFVHISGIGLTYGPLGEMEDIRYANAELTAETIQAHPDVTTGVKVRQGRGQVGDNGVAPLRKAVEAAEAASTRVMTHIGAGVPLPDVLALMRGGDIVTHCFQGRGDTIFTEVGQLLPEVHDARERGIIFDVGHGGGSFHFPTGRRAIENGFLPDVISSDLHSLSVEGPAFDMPTTASKFLNMGMTLTDVIAAVTCAPARSIGRDDTLGSLRVGDVADVGVFAMEEGEFEFEDTHDITEIGTSRLTSHLTMRAGEVWYPADVVEQFGRPEDTIPSTVRRANGAMASAAGIVRRGR
jgi:dihydroorotase